MKRILFPLVLSLVILTGCGEKAGNSDSVPENTKAPVVTEAAQDSETTPATDAPDDSDDAVSKENAKSSEKTDASSAKTTTVQSKDAPAGQQKSDDPAVSDAPSEGWVTTPPDTDFDDNTGNHSEAKQTKRNNTETEDSQKTEDDIITTDDDGVIHLPMIELD